MGTPEEIRKRQQSRINFNFKLFSTIYPPWNSLINRRIVLSMFWLIRELSLKTLPFPRKLQRKNPFSSFPSLKSSGITTTPPMSRRSMPMARVSANVTVMSNRRGFLTGDPILPRIPGSRMSPKRISSSFSWS